MTEPGVKVCCLMDEQARLLYCVVPASGHHEQSKDLRLPCVWADWEAVSMANGRLGKTVHQTCLGEQNTVDQRNGLEQIFWTFRAPRTLRPNVVCVSSTQCPTSECSSQFGGPL